VSGELNPPGELQDSSVSWESVREQAENCQLREINSMILLWAISVGSRIPTTRGLSVNKMKIPAARGGQSWGVLVGLWHTLYLELEALCESDMETDSQRLHFIEQPIAIPLISYFLSCVLKKANYRGKKKVVIIR
jgi:hypothetical protein